MDDRPPLLKQDTSRFRLNLKCYFPCRYVLAILSFSGFCVSNAMRASLSVALVAMVNSSYSNVKAVTANNPECRRNTSEEPSKESGMFNWDQEMQGLILSSTYYGYIFTQLPGSLLVKRVGPKYLFGVPMFITSVFTILTPAAAHHSVEMLILVRILQGLVMGVTFPAMHAMWSSWAPPLERSKLCALAYSGIPFGGFLGMYLSGLLCASDLWGGWPSTFYIFGSVALVWFFTWMIFAHDKPIHHPWISTEEREYILSSLGAKQEKKRRKILWRQLLTSLPVWAIITAHFCFNWVNFTCISLLPSYFREALNFAISKTGFVSGLPYLLHTIVGVGGGQLADWLRSRGILTTGQTRKVSLTAGFLIPASLIVSTSYVTCDQPTLAVVLCSLATGISALSSISIFANILDIANRYSEHVMAISNLAATIPGIVAPYLVGIITNNQPTTIQWQKVFFINAGIFVLGWITYIFLGSGKPQPWNTPFEDLVVPVAIPREPKKPVMTNILTKKKEKCSFPPFSPNLFSDHTGQKSVIKP
ncbi:unnamed protein product [Pocillopora meandrina]|uniref:Sialin n=1 Tax=Pocillopora meandrina TaxID=46732 RepID=A0AAU9XNW3_9CNID|nr:unnamed protein product [Pocillopora meandrina]